MKLENFVVVTKGLCLMVIPTFTAIGAGLPEIGIPIILGLPLKFWTLLCAAIVAGAGGLLGFISTSFGSFLLTRPVPSGESGSTLRSETVTVQTKNEPSAATATPPNENKPGQ
jgi:hypothetical protein